MKKILYVNVDTEEDGTPRDDNAIQDKIGFAIFGGSSDLRVWNENEWAKECPAPNPAKGTSFFKVTIEKL
jgi:hypothetical protein